MECSIIHPALSLLIKHLVIGQRQKAPNFSAFQWSPHGSLVSTGQHFLTMKVLQLPKRTETSLITESDQSGPNHQLLQLCTARTVWFDSDQAVQAVHSCNSWYSFSVGHFPVNILSVPDAQLGYLISVNYKVYNSNCHQIGHNHLTDHAHCIIMPKHEALCLLHKICSQIVAVTFICSGIDA